MKRPRFRTTRARLTLLSLGVLGIAAVLADGGLYSIAVISTARASDAALRHQAELIASGLRLSDLGASYLGGDLPIQAEDGVATDVSVIGANGLITSTDNNPLRPATLEALAAPVIRTHRSVWTDIADSKHIERRIYVVWVESVDPPAALIVERSVASQNLSLGWTRWLLAIVSILFVAVGGVVAYWQAGRVLRPVHDIAQLARTLSERNLHRRVDIDVPDDELGDLVTTFNEMLGRLEVSFETMGRFIADASHELRGPLTQMRSEIELATTKPGSNADMLAALGAVESEVAHMTDMVDKLLLLARADAGVLRPTRGEIDVSDFMHEVAARWTSVAERCRVQIDVAAPDSGVVIADVTLTRRVLDNLVENAIRHSPEDGHIKLRAWEESGAWTLEVADEGNGVPASQRKRIFNRFARADDVRTRDGLGGTGLGLAVSETLARVQDADLTLVDGNGSGAAFRLTFAPVTNAHGARTGSPV
jgi:signal transduction histidine kinase